MCVVSCWNTLYYVYCVTGGKYTKSMCASQQLTDLQIQ